MMEEEYTQNDTKSIFFLYNLSIFGMIQSERELYLLVFLQLFRRQYCESCNLMEWVFGYLVIVS